MARNRTNARKKIATVKQWKESGLSQVEFCRRKGMQQWQLSEWKRLAKALEGQEDALDGRGVKPSMNTPPGACKAKVKETHRANRQLPSPTAVEPPPFVPVQLLDASIGDSREEDASANFACVLEIVLKRGQTVRVAPNCQPQFLHAVLSTLDLV
jgi:hypothetical protein